MPSPGDLLAGAAVAAGLLGCTPTPVPRPAAKPPAAAAIEPAAPPPASLPWPVSGGGCRQLAAAVAALPAADRARLAPAAAPLALSVRYGAATLSPAAALAAVTPDLPLPVDDGGARCVLVVEAAPTSRAAPRRPLAHEVVRLTYQAGGTGQANPEHRRLRRELRELERDDGFDLLATGDPALDLVGLVAGGVLEGIDAVLDGRRAAAARARLAATPARLAEPVWEPYTFEVTTVEATRGGRLHARLVDLAAAEAWQVAEDIVESRRFRVAEGRRSRDRTLLEGGGGGLAASVELTVWEQAGLRPSLAALLAALAVAPPVTPATSDLAPPAPPVDPSRGDVGASVEARVGPDGVRRFRLRDSPPPVSAGPS